MKKLGRYRFPITRYDFSKIMIYYQNYIVVFFGDSTQNSVFAIWTWKCWKDHALWTNLHSGLLLKCAFSHFREIRMWKCKNTKNTPHLKKDHYVNLLANLNLWKFISHDWKPISTQFFHRCLTLLRTSFCITKTWNR